MLGRNSTENYEDDPQEASHGRADRGGAARWRLGTGWRRLSQGGDKRGTYLDGNTLGCGSEQVVWTAAVAREKQEAETAGNESERGPAVS